MTAKGNRLKINFRTPCSPLGQRSGESVTNSRARSNSATKLRAAISLRPLYHIKADLNSSRASGCISIGLTAIEEGGDLAACGFPRNGFHFARIQLFDPASNLNIPLLFHRLVYRVVQAFEQRASKGGARFGGKGQRFFQYFRNVFSHASILLRSGKSL